MYKIWYCACVCAKLLQLCLTLCNPMDPKVALQAPLSMGFPSKNTGVGCHFLLQGIVPTQGLDPGRLHCRQTRYQRSFKGSPLSTNLFVS